MYGSRELLCHVHVHLQVHVSVLVHLRVHVRVHTQLYEQRGVLAPAPTTVIMIARLSIRPALVVSYNSASISDELQAPTQDLKKGGSVAKLMSNAHAPSWQRNHNSTIHRSEE